MQLSLTNTKTKSKEPFSSQVKGKVSLYVCGITPYNYAHVGHARCYVTFDVLVRLLTYLGFEVTYVRNFTDIDDKLLAAAKEQGDEGAYTEIARTFERSFHKEMKQLGCLDPQEEPRVTENIPEIIALIEKLIAKGKAYAADGDVYYDVESFSGYGKLSGRRLEETQPSPFAEASEDTSQEATAGTVPMGARIEVSEHKKHQADFALWKGNKDKQFWESPWGYGRPGWHIECSALAKKFLGTTIDIHGGGADLIFPHHENELAQSEGAYDTEFVHYWVHNGLVNVAAEKMSKSLGNFSTLRELFKQYDPMVVRFYLLQSHYRSPIEFTEAGLQAAQTAYEKLVDLLKGAGEVPARALADGVVHEMLEALCDDMNTPKLLGAVFRHAAAIRQDSVLAASVKAVLLHVLGLTLVPVSAELEITPEIEELIEKRIRARADKNWAEADAIREQLVALGYESKDKKS